MIPHTPGTQKSSDPSDPTIYPVKAWEEAECPHGNSNKGDCFVCLEEDKAEVKRKAEEKAKQDKAEDKL